MFIDLIKRRLIVKGQGLFLQQQLQPMGHGVRSTRTVVVMLDTTSAVPHQTTGEVIVGPVVTFRQYEPERMLFS